MVTDGVLLLWSKSVREKAAAYCFILSKKNPQRNADFK